MSRASGGLSAQCGVSLTIARDPCRRGAVNELRVMPQEFSGLGDCSCCCGFAAARSKAADVSVCAGHETRERRVVGMTILLRASQRAALLLTLQLF